MAEKTTNYNLTKPSSEDFYDIGVQNDNMDVIDEELKNLNDNLTAHSNATNPHKITASTVGLGNVPNVATNEQTPTYTEASTLATLTSGEKMSVAFGKIKKAITDFISHISDTNKHNKAESKYSVIIGQGAQELYPVNGRCVSIGYNSSSGDGVSVGYRSSSSGGVSIGSGAETSIGVAIGCDAKTEYEHMLIDAIQLGTGTNIRKGTFQVYKYPLLDENGTVPNVRLWKHIADEQYTETALRSAADSETEERFNTVIASADFSFSEYDEVLLVLNGSISISESGGTSESNNNVYAYITSDLNADGVVFAHLVQHPYQEAYTLELRNVHIQLTAANYLKREISSDLYETNITKSAFDPCSGSIIAFSDDVYIGLRVANANIEEYAVTADITISIYGKEAI